MTRDEKKLLDELKGFFSKKFGEEWPKKFKNYTKKLVEDGHLDQTTIDEFLDDDEPNDIVKRFNAFRNTPTTRIVPTTRTVNTAYDGCGSSSRSSRNDGCGSTPSRPSNPSRSDGCGSTPSRRSSC